MKVDFSGQKVLVTGGTRGIGAAIAQQFLQSGAQVIVTGKNSTSWSEVKNNFYDFEKHVQFWPVDLSSQNQLQEFAQKLKTEVIDILVNNAGINIIQQLAEVSLENWQTVQDVNVKAPFYLSQAVAQGMQSRKFGRIINIGSVFGQVTKEKRLAYTTSKAALIGMTKTLALELASHGVLVNCVSPGFIDTDLTRQILGESGIKEMVAQVPMKALGSATDIAQLVLFLASKNNGFITGQNIVIDGGFTCA